jgi:hypothetical protein
MIQPPSFKYPSINSSPRFALYCSVTAHPFCKDGQTDRQGDKDMAQLISKFWDFVAANVTKMENWDEPLWLSIHWLNYTQHLNNFHWLIYTH